VPPITLRRREFLGGLALSSRAADMPRPPAIHPAGLLAFGLPGALQWRGGRAEAPAGDKGAAWRDAVVYRMPGYEVTKARAAHAADWLKGHLVSVSRRAGESPLLVIAWKDPTLEPRDPNCLAGYLIDDTLWSAKALKLFDPVAAQEMESGLQRAGWYGNGLHDVLFHPLKKLLHCPADSDFVHGYSLGRFPAADGRMVDLRVFRQKWDAKFDVGHPQLFAEHAVYRAIFDYWQGREDQARRRIRDIIRPRSAGPESCAAGCIFWDREAQILVDRVNLEDWFAIQKGERPVCRHYTFKLGLLIYAIRLLGMEHDLGAPLTGMKERLWSAQTQSGGVAHFVDVQTGGSATAGRGSTGEATAIAILAEVIKLRRPSGWATKFTG